MILVKPSFQFEFISNASMLNAIESAGRTCYKSENAITADSATAFVRKIIKNGHESVLEHEKLTCRVVCDRGVSHEIVRHRIASYSQESNRYCDYSDGHVCFVIPPWTCLEEGTYSNYHQISQVLELPESTWANSCFILESIYKSLRQYGWSPQQARTVLPNSLKTEIVMTMNLREWRHFFRLRTSSAAHPQMQEIAIPMLNHLKAWLPDIFFDF